MDDRLAIGATSAAVAIFSVVLLSNFALYVASQDRSRLYSLSDGEDSMSIGASTLIGAASFNILVQAQSVLASNTFECHTATRAVASLVGGLVDGQQEGGLIASTSTQVVAERQVTDNLTMLRPFDGGAAGQFDISISTRVGGGFSAGVSVNKFEVHFAHLPVRLGRLVSDCLGTLDNLSRELASTRATNCTASKLAPILANMSRSLTSAANRDGFYLKVGYSISGSAPCTLELRISIGAANVSGPAGPFNVRMSAEESASFGQ